MTFTHSVEFECSFCGNVPCTCSPGPLATYELPWPPSVNHYWRHGRRVTISAEGRVYRQLVCFAVGSNKLESFQRCERIQAWVVAVPPDRRRRDLDNIFKALFDSLQFAGAFRDDSQIKRIVADLVEPEAEGRVVVQLRELRR